MRILFVVGLFPSLSETFILNQITGLIDRGHEVDIYAIKPINDISLHSDFISYDLLRYTYYRRVPNRLLLQLLYGFILLCSHGLKAPGTFLRSLNILRYGKRAATMRLPHEIVPVLGSPPYDIIHCHFGPNGCLGMILRDLGVIDGKLITTFHGYDITTSTRQHGEGLYDRLFNAGDLFLPISEHWRRRLIQLGCQENKIVVHRMGVDCNRFLFTPRQLDETNGVRLVSVGRLVEKKGFEYAIRAVANLLEFYQDIEYTIVGDGPLKKHLQELVQKLNVSNVIHFVGQRKQEEVIDIFAKSHILLGPSVTTEDGNKEGIPVTLMEAMAVGLPVLSTLHSGIPELVKDGVSGFLVPERDVDALGNRLAYLIEHPETWPEIGLQGREFIEEHYNINKLNDRLVEIYEQLQ